MAAEGRAAFEKIHPLGKVPFLKPSEDWQVLESTSIIEYLEDKFSKTPRLIPAAGGDALAFEPRQDSRPLFFVEAWIGTGIAARTSMS